MIIKNSDDHYCINFERIELKFYPNKLITLDDYVVFYSKYTELKLDVKGTTEKCEDYNLLNLKSIKRPAIVLHKKYIHKLMFNMDGIYNLDFTPTKSLKLHLSSYCIDSKGLINYLNTHSFNKLHIEVEFHKVENVEPSKFKCIIDTVFDCLNVNTLIIS